MAGDRPRSIDSVDNVGRSVSRHAILNTVLGIVATALVAALIYLQVNDDTAPPATTTIATSGKAKTAHTSTHTTNLRGRDIRPPPSFC